MSTRFADSNYLHAKIPFYILLCVELVYYIRNAIRPGRDHDNLSGLLEGFATK